MFLRLLLTLLTVLIITIIVILFLLLHLLELIFGKLKTGPGPTLFSGEPLLNGQLPRPRERQLNRDLTVFLSVTLSATTNVIYYMASCDWLPEQARWSYLRLAL